MKKLRIICQRPLKKSAKKPARSSPFQANQTIAKKIEEIISIPISIIVILSQKGNILAMGSQS